MWITDEIQSIDGKQRIVLKAVEKNWENWQIRMMDQLRPSFLLPFEFTLEPNEILYEVTGKEPLSNLARMTEEALDTIFSEIETLTKKCRECWLDPGNFCRDPQHLYLNPQWRISWIYEPSVEPEEENAWKKTLLRSILQLGIEKGWEDRVILKCYHRYLDNSNDVPFIQDLQENLKQNSELKQGKTEEQLKKPGRKFPYFQRKH